LFRNRFTICLSCGSAERIRSCPLLILLIRLTPVLAFLSGALFTGGLACVTGFVFLVIVSPYFLVILLVGHNILSGFSLTRGLTFSLLDLDGTLNILCLRAILPLLCQALHFQQ